MSNIKIDGDMLMRALAKRKLDPRSVGEEMGYNRSYLQDCYRRGNIGLRAVKALEKMGIHQNDYEWIENEQKELPILAEGSPSKQEIDKDFLTALYDIIKRAVKDAIREEREEHE